MPWENRKHRRVLTEEPVLIFGELTLMKGQIVNLSTGGCAVVAAQAPEKGQRLSLVLPVPGQETSIDIQLAIVRWSTLGLFGVEFICVNTAHHELGCSLDNLDSDRCDVGTLPSLVALP